MPRTANVRLVVDDPVLKNDRTATVAMVRYLPAPPTGHRVHRCDGHRTRQGKDEQSMNLNAQFDDHRWMTR
ncbi:hypothetical protein, partial [Frankia sp. Cr1]|uniref:hypothetical protein n=1 Tax=Frankia sp. Cr1 TaxID=3073931 RepID=UPI002AD47F60